MPKFHISATRSAHHKGQVPGRQRHERHDQKHTVEPVQNAAVSGEDGTEVLDAALALDGAGEQVAHDAHHAAENGDEDEGQPKAIRHIVVCVDLPVPQGAENR